MLKLGTSINAAFKMALETWASWVKERIDLRRTHVFFRTYEPSHWRCVFLAAYKRRSLFFSVAV